MNKTRPKQLSFRVSEEEYQQLQQKISESGKNQQEYILSCVLEKQIVNAAALLAKDHGGPQIRTLVLMWPVTDAGYDWDSYAEYGRQRFLTAPLMKWMFEQYVSDPAQRGSDLMSPVRASAERLRGLPPTLIAVAENDILRDEGEKMGRLLDAAGVEVTTVRFNGVIHDWGMLNGFAGLHPTRTLVRLAGAVLRDYLRE